MTRQLAFDLPAQTTWRREDFFVSPGNALALATLDDWHGWPRGKMLLIGPEGAGKTHLAHIWAEGAGATMLAASALTDADIPGLATTAVCLEDAETVAGQPEAEEALFHLHNLLAERNLPLLLTAAQPPRDWGLCLPDLASRLQATALVRLDAPDDGLLSAVLIKLFADRQIAVPPSLIPYLVSRMDRSFQSARELVAALDAHALAKGRPITRQLAAEVLDEQLRLPFP